MTKKYYWAMAVMAAFVVGTIATATPVFAPPPEDDGEGGWKVVVADLQEQIDTLGAETCTDITGSEDLCDGVDNESGILGFYIVKENHPITSSEETANLAGIAIGCDDTDIAISGGYTLNLVHRLLSESHNLSPGSSTGYLISITDVQVGETVLHEVICADFDPLHVP